MTDYTELVKALLSASTVSTAWEKLMRDAADAIEALDAKADYWMGQAQEEYEKRLQQMPKRGEIVRCGECKWYGIYYAKKDGTPDKRYRPSVCLRGKYAKRRDPDWFCADGERKEE